MFSNSSLAIYAMRSWCLATRWSTASNDLFGVNVVIGCNRSIVKKYAPNGTTSLRDFFD